VDGDQKAPAVTTEVGPKLNRARSDKPLAIRLSLHSLGQVVPELVPFYGGGCPITVVYSNYRPESWIVRTTLGNIEDGTAGLPDQRSEVILVG
jgi:precorrin-4/cobalt-precorrin-4 C11-methyltransferase